MKITAVNILIAMLLCVFALMSACSEKVVESEETELSEPRSEIAETKTPETPSPELAAEAEKNVEALEEWDAIHEFPEDPQLNMPIDELDLMFDRKIANTVSAEGYVVEIEQIYKDYISENEIVIARFYYDKPLLSSEGEAAARINAALDAEASGFFFGNERAAHYKWGIFDRFDYYITRQRVYFGDSELEQAALQFAAEQMEVQFRCSVSTSVACLDGAFLSVVDDFYWMAGGVGRYYSHGLNFSLETGELLPVSYFVGDDLESFKKLVEEELETHYGETNPAWVESAVTEHKNYEFSDYNYYYDGNHVILILSGEPGYYDYNCFLTLSDSYIII